MYTSLRLYVDELPSPLPLYHHHHYDMFVCVSFGFVLEISMCLMSEGFVSLFISFVLVHSVF